MEDDSDYTDLYRKLTKQPKNIEPELGEIKKLKSDSIKRGYSLIEDDINQSENPNDNQKSKKQIYWERACPDVIHELGEPGTALFDFLNTDFNTPTPAELANKLFGSPFDPVLDYFQQFLNLQIKNNDMGAVKSIERLSHIWLTLVAAECDSSEQSTLKNKSHIHIKATLPVKPDVEGQLAANESRSPILILIGEELWSPLDFSPKLPNGADKNDSKASQDFKHQIVAKTQSGIQALLNDTRNQFKDFLCQPRIGLNKENVNEFSKAGLKKILEKRLASHSKKYSGNIYIRLPFAHVEENYSELEELYDLYEELLIVKVSKDIDENRSSLIIQLNEIIYDAQQYAIKKNQN